MDIADRIANKEYLINIKKNLKHMLEKNGLIDMAKETQEDIDDLKKSIEDDREVQKIEAQTSGRKTWRDDFWKYTLLVIITSIVSALATKLILG